MSMAGWFVRRRGSLPYREAQYGFRRGDVRVVVPRNQWRLVVECIQFGPFVADVSGVSPKVLLEACLLGLRRGFKLLPLKLAF